MDRPKGWKNYCGKGFKYGGWTPPDEETRRACAGIYEAGADAIYEFAKEEGKRELLEALKAEGILVNVARAVSLLRGEERLGRMPGVSNECYIVVIPKE